MIPENQNEAKLGIQQTIVGSRVGDRNTVQIIDVIRVLQTRMIFSRTKQVAFIAELVLIALTYCQNDVPS